MSNKIVQPRRSLRGSNRFNISSDLSKDNILEDFDVSIKSTQLPKEMKTEKLISDSLKEDIPNSPKMALRRSHFYQKSESDGLKSKDEIPDRDHVKDSIEKYRLLPEVENSIFEEKTVLLDDKNIPDIQESGKNFDESVKIEYNQNKRRSRRLSPSKSLTNGETKNDIQETPLQENQMIEVQASENTFVENDATKKGTKIVQNKRRGRDVSGENDSSLIDEAKSVQENLKSIENKTESEVVIHNGNEDHTELFDSNSIKTTDSDVTNGHAKDIDSEPMEVDNVTAIVTREISNKEKNELNNNSDEGILNEILQQNPYAKYHGYSVNDSKEELNKPDSDNDSALGSLVSEEKFEEDKYKGYKPGAIVWAGYSGFDWYPSMVWYQDKFVLGALKVKDALFLKYFNYADMGGSIKLRNIFPFTNMAAFWKEVIDVRKIKKSKIKKFTPRVLRAIEEAKIFIEFEDDLRMKIYKEIVRLQTGPSNLRVIEKDIYDDRNEVPEELRPFIQKYIDELKAYDINTELRENEEKQERLARALKEDLKEISSERNWSAIPSRASIEKTNVRQSTRIIEKRRFSFLSLTSNESTSVNEDISQPAPKKRRLSRASADENIPLEEKFKFQPKDILFLFKNAPSQNVCMECFEPDDVHQCKGCPYFYHEKCSQQSKFSITTIRHQTGDSDTIIENKIVTLTCKSCAAAVKSCFICKNSIEGMDKYICHSADCKQSYHKSCLAKCCQSKNRNPGLKNSCPQHECHTCLSKNINRSGAVVKCVKCPAAYHPDIYCIPAGSQVLSKAQIICSRHKSAKDKITPLNLDYCCRCMQSGELICCDSCPMTIHRDCLPAGTDPDQESFICDDCEAGIMPLYNTIVWAKVGAYRWWPAYILTPQASASKEGNKIVDRQFCVRFFGSYDYYWVTSDRVFSYSDQGAQPTKSKNKRLDVSFSKAILEADEMISKLEHMRDDQVKSKPKSYRIIEKNQPIPPVKLLKLKKEDEIEICGCSANDPLPCGIDSDCILRTLHMECGERCPAGKSCQNQMLRNRQYANIYLKSVGNRGFGAFAGSDIEAGSLVIEYVGELVNKAEKNRRHQAKRARGDKDYYFMGIDGDLFIDAEPAGNKSRFINHSCDPNCITKKINVDGNTRMAIIANQFIKKDTELTFNYQFDSDDSLKHPCFCGTNKCIGFIGVAIKKEESEGNGKIIKAKRLQKNAKKLSAPILRVPKKSQLELNELDPMIPMIMSLASELEENL